MASNSLVVWFRVIYHGPWGLHKTQITAQNFKPIDQSNVELQSHHRHGFKNCKKIKSLQHPAVNSFFCGSVHCKVETGRVQLGAMVHFDDPTHPSYSPSSSSNSPSSSAVASWYCWYSETKSFMLDSASVNSISSIPSPVYQCKKAWRRKKEHLGKVPPTACAFKQSKRKAEHAIEMFCSKCFCKCQKTHLTSAKKLDHPRSSSISRWTGAYDLVTKLPPCLAAEHGSEVFLSWV